MTLNPEWRRRIDHWRNYLPHIFYEPLGHIALKCFVTKDSLRPKDVEKKTFKPIGVGDVWGTEWSLGWFKGTVKLEKAAAGKRIVLKPQTGADESIVWCNGVSLGAVDHSGRELLLTPKAKGDESYDILLETFGGNYRDCGGGPAPEKFSGFAPPKHNHRLGDSTYGIWNEEAYQLWLDLVTLTELRDGIVDKDSLRIAEIDAGLQKVTVVLDFELPKAQVQKGIQAARDVLKPLLACHNGSTAPAMTCVGHSHIDVAWLWPLAETERKCCRTFSNQLALMEQYPEYRFLQSQAYLYNRTKILYPKLYDRIRQAVRKGQWIPDGAMWVEADTNISGGEALIRQFLYGKRFFKEEFGVDNRLMWLPDVFGYSGAVPQIMKGCGIEWFSTQKIFWTYNGGDPFPYNLFWWEGIDGTKVLSYLHNDYNSETRPSAILARWRERPQKDATHPARLVPFGWGDGGGGPTREHLEFLRREKDLEGLPRCRQDSPEAFFRSLRILRRRSSAASPRKACPHGLASCISRLTAARIRLRRKSSGATAPANLPCGKSNSGEPRARF